MSREPRGVDGAEFAAHGRGEPSDIVRVCRVECVQIAGNPCVESGVGILADQMFSDALPAAASGVEDEGCDRLCPVEQPAAVEALGVVRELVDSADVEHPDRGQWYVEHAHGLGNCDYGRV